MPTLRNLCPISTTAFLAALAVGAVCSLAVAPSHWMHTSEADFKAGTFDNVVATNLGDLKLSREVKMLLGQDPRVSAVYCLAEAPDGTIYAGTGPEGVLLKIQNQVVAPAAELGDNVGIFSLLVDSQGRLLAGTGGERGRILRFDRPGDKPRILFEADDVQYIWSMVQTADGTLYAATGPNGQLYQLNDDGSHKVLFDADENNLLSLIAGPNDALYVGTDPNGMVYRINGKTGDVRVMYDAAETEISALAIDAAGNVYAGTAQSTDTGAVESSEVAVRHGRPESEAVTVPIPSDEPAAPKPPEVPDPAPGEPLPIPKTDPAEPKRMMILGPDEGEMVTEVEATRMDAAGAAAGGGVATTAEPAANGNAIYRIDPEGFVTEVFRQPVMIFSVIERNGTLVVATGNEGEIYQLIPGAEETSVLAKVDSKQILCLLPSRDGRVYAGMANSGDIGVATGGYAPRGTYTSPVLDAAQISRFGKLHLLGSLPAGSDLKISTRSGNVQESSAAGWSDWSPEASASEYVQIASPPARFFQYRLSFASDGGKETPVVASVDAAYLLPNLPPRVKSVAVSSPATATDDDALLDTPGVRTITWDASDPNDDALVYSLYFRSGTRGPWVLLKEKLKEPTFQWAARNVADGSYQIKVEASDAAANAVDAGKSTTRLSDPVIVDNTPPVIGDVSSTVTGQDVKLAVKAVDRTSAVASLAYSVDSASDWQTVLPSDSIADSPEELYEFSVKGVAPGPHQITVRATDSHGNSAMETLNVTIEKD